MGIARTRRRARAPLVALIAAFGVVACGGGGTASTSAPSLPATPAPATSAPGPTGAAPTAGAPAASPATAPVPPHVMVILEENREYASVIGSPSAPYMNSLANSYGLATRWYAVSHPSLPNYLALISGSTQGVQDDGTGYSFAGPTVVDQLAARGIGWRAYMEGMPSPCYRGAGGPNGYAKKHDPFVYFRSITGNPAQCSRVVPFSNLATDLANNTAPPFIWVTPNLCDDGHDCSTATADGWLRTEVRTVMSSTWYRQGASVVVTWDEGGSDNGCCGGAAGGRIPTIVVSPRGHQRLDAPGDHYGTLRAIEEAYGLGYLGAAGTGSSGDARPLMAS